MGYGRRPGATMEGRSDTKTGCVVLIAPLPACPHSTPYPTLIPTCSTHCSLHDGLVRGKVGHQNPEDPSIPAPT